MSLTAGAEFIEHHGKYDDGALNNQLPVEGDVHERETVIENGDDQSADEGTEYGTDAADKTCAA